MGLPAVVDYTIWVIPFIPLVLQGLRTWVLQDLTYGFLVLVLCCPSVDRHLLLLRGSPALTLRRSTATAFTTACSGITLVVFSLLPLRYPGCSTGGIPLRCDHSISEYFARWLAMTALAATATAVLSSPDCPGVVCTLPAMKPALQWLREPHSAERRLVQATEADA